MKKLLGIVVLLPAMALAQAPAKLGYQGRLLKADGSPETGVLSVGFALYESGVGGNPLWTESQSLALSDGFYATMLGERTPLPGDLFAGAERHLEVSAGGVPLSPRQKIGSVPFALVATDARNLAGGTVNASALTVKGGP